MLYKNAARRCREAILHTGWRLGLVRGYGRPDDLNLLKAKGIRFKVVRVNGYRMKIDLNDNVISGNLFLKNCWEPYESRLMTRLLHPGMTFIDVGAHIGYYSLLAAQAVGPTGCVVSFEPSPDNFALLSENIRLNGRSKTILAENAALGAQPGEAHLYLSTYNTGDHRIYSTLSDDDEIFNDGAQRQSVRVPVISLDENLTQRRISRVDMIKIDVQGAEMGVLKGMMQTLLRNPQVLVFTEFWSHGLRRAGVEPQALLDFLVDEIGLNLFHILPAERRVQRIEPASFACQTRNADPLEQIDLLCCAYTEAALMEKIGR